MLNALDGELPADPAVTAAFDRAWSSEDLAEGRAAFAERRPPTFRGT
jgi:enoyl-CoA hydratase